jgi:hypothetical protein
MRADRAEEMAGERKKQGGGAMLGQADLVPRADDMRKDGPARGQRPSSSSM